MAEAPILGGGDKTVALDDAVFGAPYNGPLVHEVVIAEMAARRQGTHSTKTRGMVRGGGAKPWRQKGTGRARAGTSRSPLWTGGGTVFGPSPRHYTVKVNRKARKAALRSALSVHAERGTISVLDPASFDGPSTKTAFGLLDGRLGGNVLIVVAPDQDVPAKSFRNLERVTVLPTEAVGVSDLIRAAQFVITESALEAITARAKKTTETVEA
jgi:large subunit ribosomal protein L4